MQAHTGASDARPATPGWRGRGVRSRDRQAYSKWNISNKISRSKYSARDKLTGWVVAPFESKLRCAPGASAGGGAESGRTLLSLVKSAEEPEQLSREVALQTASDLPCRLAL